MPHSRAGVVWRFIAAAVVVVLFSATTTAVAGLLKVKQIAHLISATPALKSPRVAVAQAGAPQTIFLVGSDHRAGTPWTSANTDSMMLVRLNASSSTINVLSIPRDLQVMLPQGGTMAPGKLNAAYSIGGPNLLIKTLQQQVFPGLVVNHIIDVNFGGFSDMVNAIGCVYTDVDRRYYHVSEPYPPSENWSSIDLQPGYEKLCGTQALEFVRFRHYDNDLTRNARQQDFLRWAKSQFSESELLDKENQLVTIFGKHAQTDQDLHTTDGVLKLFDLVALSAGHTVRQITFPAILPNSCGGAVVCYVTADPAAERAAYQQFLTPTVPAPPAKATGGSARGGAHAKGSAAPSAPPPPAPVQAPPPGAIEAQASGLANAGLPVYVPHRIADGSYFCVAGVCEDGFEGDGSYPRKYTLADEHGVPHASYRITLALNETLGHFYGIEGTTWQNPPILNGPHETRVVNGKQLLVYYNGHKVTLVAWHGPHALYWVSNDLTDDLSGAQMLAIAASLSPA